MKNKYVDLFSNTFIFGIGNFLSKMVFLVLMPLYTGVLLPEEYNLAEMLNNLSQLALPILTLCLYEAVFRFSISEETNHQKLLSSALILVLKIFSGVFVILLLSSFFINVYYVWIFAMITFSLSIRQLFAQFTRGIGLIKIFAVSGIINALALIVFNVIFLLLLNGGATGYLLSILFANVVSIIYIYLTAKLHSHISLKRSDNYLLKSMILYSLPLIPNALSWWLVNMSNRFIIFFYCGAATAGIFIAASKLPSIINMITQVFMQAWKISSSKEISEKNSETFFGNIYILFSSLIWVFTSGILLVIPLLTPLLLRNDFQEGEVYIPLLLLAAAVNSFSGFFGSFYIAARKTKGVFVSTTIGAIVNITLGMITVPFIGVFGVLLSGVIGYLIIVGFRIFDTRKYLVFEINWKVTIFCFVLLSAQSVISTFRTTWSKPLSIGLFLIILITVILSLRKLWKMFISYRRAKNAEKQNAEE